MTCTCGSTDHYHASDCPLGPDDRYTLGVICSYYECPERATKNLVVTREVDGATDTWDIPYCDLHYEENK